MATSWEQLYEIRVYDHSTGNLLAVYPVGGMSTLQYSRRRNDIGTLAMTLPYERGIEDHFALDNLVQVLRRNTVGGARTVEETYLVRRTIRLRENTTELYTIGAMSLNHLLTRRVIDPADDPLQAGGYSTKAGTASNVIAEYAYEQLGAGASSNRKITELDIWSDGTGSTVGGRYRYEPLYETLMDLALKGDVAIHIQHVEGNLLQLVAGTLGTDRTQTTGQESDRVVFSPARMNVLQPMLTLDRESEANFIYVTGEGEPSNQRVFKVYSTAQYDSLWNRSEVKFSPSSDKDSSALDLINDGRRELLDKMPRTEFALSLESDSDMARYNVHWTLHDLITVQWDDIAEDMRVVSIEIQLSNTETIQVVLEKDSIL